MEDICKETFTNFKRKKVSLEKVAKIYIKAKVLTSNQYVAFIKEQKVKEDPQDYGNNDGKDLPYYNKFKDLVEIVLKNIDEKYVVILKNDFFEKNNDPNWWFSFYSRSTYYRLKCKAMEEFLNLFV